MCVFVRIHMYRAWNDEIKNENKHNPDHKEYVLDKS